MKKRIKLISLAVAAGMLISATNVSAYTRQYTFHMNTSYAHGKEPNCGYAATKDDNEAIAYITMTRYKINSGTPQISMWVAPKRNICSGNRCLDMDWNSSSQIIWVQQSC